MGRASQISLFLEEPTTCNYILTVKAAFLCPLLHNTDQQGSLLYLWAWHGVKLGLQGIISLRRSSGVGTGVARVAMATPNFIIITEFSVIVHERNNYGV